jgi:HEAT repeat protein
MVNSPAEKTSGRKLFYGLFIFPLLIAVGMAVLLCTVVLLTREAETPESLITAIKTGAPSKRWQKAFELSNELNQGRGLIRETGVMKEVIHVLTDRSEYDAKTRSYMAIALSKFDDPEAVNALRAALSKEEDSSVQIYLIWALGLSDAKEAAGDVSAYLTSADEDLRKTAAYVLGVLKDPAMIPRLEPLVTDSSRDVRWNAALSLARLGSEAGYPVLMKMLDREALASVEKLPDEKIEEIMVNAVKGLAILKKPESFPFIAQIANTDKSLKVRQAAMEALEFQKTMGTSNIQTAIPEGIN